MKGERAGKRLRTCFYKQTSFGDFHLNYFKNGNNVAIQTLILVF